MRTSGEQTRVLKDHDDSEDESEILEESPCGRWLKRREEVQQRDVPGIDAAYLALDTEEGFEVVWNEVRFSERKKFKAQEEKLRDIFENLVRLDHPNIVKFHKYWIDNRDEKPRVIFITEYMSSGSLKQFLKRTKRNVKKPPLQAWERWCTQVLSALNFLHSCTPPIIHGNLSCDTIYIQHNGLIKIGCVAPDAIHQHVKTCKDSLKNTHFIAPEFGMSVSPAVDIYSFGVCALEMAALEIQGNGDSGSLVTEEHIWRTLETLEGISQRDLIRACLHEDPGKRPSARELLFHPTLFEVPSLKLLAAHVVVHHSANVSEIFGSSGTHRFYSAGVVIAEIRKNQDVSFCYSLRDVPAAEKLDKYVEDVKFGIYPLSVFEVQTPSFPASRAVTPDSLAPPPHVESPEPMESEKRRVVSMACSVSRREDGQGFQMLLLLRMDDQMNRQLSCSLSERDTSKQLAGELVQHSLINSMDMEKLANLMENTRRECVVRDPLSNQGIVEPGNFENLTAEPVNLDKNP